MPPLVVPNALLCVLTWGDGGQFDHNPQNVFGLHIDGGSLLLQATVDDIAANFDSAWTTANIGSAWPASMSPIDIVVTDIRSETGPQFQAFLGATTSGTGDLLPGELAAVTSLRTALRGRSFRGRFYWPSMTEGQNTATGNINSTTATNLSVFWSTFHSLMAAESYSDGVGVISRKLSQLTVCTTFTTDTNWDSQRRRGKR